MGSWDGVPWMIGGGVKHSTNVARLLSFGAFGGREGIIGEYDLQVRARDVPAGSIRVSPGACSILNKNATVKYEAYVGRLPIEDVVTINPTGSGVGRTDLVVARVKNPFLSGEPFPEPSQQEIADGTAEFIETYVISGVPGPAPGTHPTLAHIKSALSGQSAIPLASIALPASTGTVQATHIKDWRTMGAVREKTTKVAVNPTTTVTVTAASYANMISTTIEVPDWATHVTLSGIASGIVVPTGTLSAAVRIALGTTIFSEPTGVTVPGNANSKEVFMAGQTAVPIPPAIRGTSQTLSFQGYKYAGGAANFKSDAGSMAMLEAVFQTLPALLP